MEFHLLIYNIQELIYAHNDADQAAKAIQFGNIRRPQPYYYGMLGEHVDYEKLGDILIQGGPVYLTQWSPEQIQLAGVGRVTGQALDPRHERFTFAKTIQLQPTSITPEGDNLALDLLWAIEQPVEDDLTAFVHLYGPGCELLSQADGYPIAGLAPFWLWSAGQTLEDNRTLPLPPDNDIEQFSIGIGLYNPATGERLPAFDHNGNRQANDVILFPLTGG